jgi:tRNA-specific 2-thiouridylase
MLVLAEALGAARLATGHYARIVRDADGPLLGAAADDAKDQTYMLARLRPDELERLWFPLGELEKPQVREAARAAGLPVAEKPESQDLCFLAGSDRESLLERLGAPAATGEIVSLDGRVLGRHQGQERFTVGQRRGLGLAGSVPLFVVDKDAASGRVTVGPREALAADSVVVHDALLYRDGARVDSVKLRYRSGSVACRVDGSAPAGPHEQLSLSLSRPVEGVAPGQVACLLERGLVIGWATIAGAAVRKDQVAHAA